MSIGQTISLPQFGSKNVSHCFSIKGLTKQEIKDLRAWVRYEKNNILEDCIQNPGKYI
jgi:hypothetical protein